MARVTIGHQIWGLLCCQGPEGAQMCGRQKTERTAKHFVLAFLVCMPLLFLPHVACEQPGSARRLSVTTPDPGQGEHGASALPGHGGWWNLASTAVIIAGALALVGVVYRQVRRERFEREQRRIRERFEIYGTLSGLRFSLQQLARAVVDAQLNQGRASAMSALGPQDTARHLSESADWGLETSRLLVAASRARERTHETLAKAQVCFDLPPEVLAAIETVFEATAFSAGIDANAIHSSADVVSWYSKTMDQVEGWLTSKFEAPLSIIVGHLADQVSRDRLESRKGKATGPAADLSRSRAHAG